ncbi:MAG: TIGR00282 family metallophosphoesterase [Patescibacteria group bacterium]
MKFLILGDIFGRPGRDTVKKLLPDLRKTHAIDFCIANAENMSHGKGFTKRTVDEMRSSGVDFFTSGNHVWKQEKELPNLDDMNFPLLRPANYPGNPPGRGFQVIEKNGVKILVINVLGQIFMHDDVDNPFHCVDRILRETADQKVNITLIDLHAEATSEKAALAQYLDGRISTLWGTHTHVATKDARILPKGTGFISDVGFTGPINSIIGLEPPGIIHRFLTGMPAIHEVASGPTVLNALVLSIDESSGVCVNIDHVQHSLSA